MNDFIVITENTAPNIISIETSSLESIGIVEIERHSSPSINILGPSAIINVSDLPNFDHTKITDFNSAVSGLLPQSVNVSDVQQIIGLSGIIPGTGIGISYDSSTGYTTINASGLSIGNSTFYLGNNYTEINGLTMISGISINSPTTLINCVIDGGSP
jgi:hypothetical protein